MTDSRSMLPARLEFQPDEAAPEQPEPPAIRARTWWFIGLAVVVLLAVLGWIVAPTDVKASVCDHTPGAGNGWVADSLCPDTSRVVLISRVDAVRVIDEYLAKASGSEPGQARQLVAKNYRAGYDRDIAGEWSEVQWIERLGALTKPTKWNGPNQWRVDVRRYGGPKFDTTRGVVSDRSYIFQMTATAPGSSRTKPLIAGVSVIERATPEKRVYPKITFAQAAASYHGPWLQVASDGTVLAARNWTADSSLYAHCQLTLPKAAGNSAGWWLHTRVGWVHGSDLTQKSGPIKGVDTCDAHYIDDALKALGPLA